MRVKKEGGWQFWVDIRKDYVIKTPRTKKEIKERVTKYLKSIGELHRKEEISRRMMQDLKYSTKLIENSKIDPKYFAYLEFLEEGKIKQRKARVLENLLKTYSKQKKIKEAKKLFDEFFKFTFLLWGYGLHEKPFKPTQNYGILNGHIVLLDPFELTANKGKVAKSLKKVKFYLTDKYFGDYPEVIKDYYNKKLREKITLKNLGKYWKKKLK